MELYEVSNRAELEGVLRAAAHPLQRQAQDNPFTVTLTGHTTRYTFRRGLTDSRAEQIIRAVRNTPEESFR